MESPNITVTAEEDTPSRTVRFQCGLLRETETFLEEDLEDVSRDAILDFVVDMLNVKVRAYSRLRRLRQGGWEQERERGREIESLLVLVSCPLSLSCLL